MLLTNNTTWYLACYVFFRDVERSGLCRWQNLGCAYHSLDPHRDVWLHFLGESPVFLFYVSWVHFEEIWATPLSERFRYIILMSGKHKLEYCLWGGLQSVLYHKTSNKTSRKRPLQMHFESICFCFIPYTHYLSKFNCKRCLNGKK